MGRFLLLCCLAAASFALFGCATITHHGDADLVDNPNVVFALVDPLKFPKVSLAKAATYSFRVLDLPQEIYPDSLLLEVPDGEDSRRSHDQPWRHCIIKASLLTLDGTPFFTKTLDFAKDWNGFSEPGDGSDHRKIGISLTDYKFDTGTSSLPRHLSYILQIVVIRPSQRPSDQLEIWAVSTLPHTRRLLHESN